MPSKTHATRLQPASFAVLRAAAVLLGPGLLLSSVASAACGDGILDTGETCDDANTAAGDGCDASCAVESGWECAPGDFSPDSDETLLDVAGPSPSWALSTDSLTVTQAVAADPALYLTLLPTGDVSLTFDLLVNTSTDDDYLGWAIGYAAGDKDSSTADWVYFDWRQTDQTALGCTATAGLAMNRVAGAVTGERELWCHSGAVSELARGTSLGSTGWSDSTTYQVQLDYSTTAISVYVDGVLEFSETGHFPAGHLGLYSYAQADTEFTLQSPVDQSVCGSLDTDGDGLTDPVELALGTDISLTDSDSDGLTDLEEVDLGTDPLVSDTDSDGLGDLEDIDPLDADTDDDGISDGDETTGSGVLSAYGATNPRVPDHA